MRVRLKAKRRAYLSTRPGWASRKDGAFSKAWWAVVASNHYFHLGKKIEKSFGQIDLPKQMNKTEERPLGSP